MIATGGAVKYISIRAILTDRLGTVSRWRTEQVVGRKYGIPIPSARPYHPRGIFSDFRGSQGEGGILTSAKGYRFMPEYDERAEPLRETSSRERLTKRWRKVRLCLPGY